ncbi:E3 ubiquitin-protein ligase XBAT31 [Pyrus ussuriensis x Pyrus communis]|uniref:E3 ubiquitin-protein ligase XBAT31 n=1 Tax=Pyrus ussuriensis x Pyrus communis TaxID=2448454 RepID=A0A5N5FGM4_9ROSA|nr:E3 ubiquitin-protein ligase XBAT31 [Pyrus ussuriensis x Pyrus communis]
MESMGTLHSAISLSHLHLKAEGGGLHCSPNERFHIYVFPSVGRERERGGERELWSLELPGARLGADESVFGQSLGLTTGSSQIFLGKLD